mgnify:CR=1 FL=1
MSSEDSKRKPYVKRVVYRMESICEPYVNHAQRHAWRHAWQHTEDICKAYDLPEVKHM